MNRKRRPVFVVTVTVSLERSVILSLVIRKKNTSVRIAIGRYLRQNPQVFLSVLPDSQTMDQYLLQSKMETLEIFEYTHLDICSIMVKT